MIKGIEIKNIPVEKIKIGDEEFKPKDRDFYENWLQRIKKDGIKKPFLVTKIGEYALMSTAIRSLDLPTTLQEVGTYGLYITTLREAYFGDSVTEMAPNALFRGSRLVLYVFENTAALDYAIENNINYVIRQGETIDDDRIPWIDGEDD